MNLLQIRRNRDTVKSLIEDACLMEQTPLF